MALKPAAVDPACLDYFQSNIRASINSVWDRIAIDEEAVADFRRMQEELLNQETWYGANVTGDAALVISQTAQAVKTTANFVRDSVNLVASPGTASGKAAVTVAQTIESVVYKVVHDEGSLEDIAVGVIKDARYPRSESCRKFTMPH